MKASSTKTNWGGDWTEKKLSAFAKYVNAYLSIMNKNSYWRTIYFDGFAGSGNRLNDIDAPNKLFEELFTTEELKKENLVYQGSAERVVRLDKKFDYYYFIDNNKDAINLLQEKLSPYTSNLNIEFRNDNANNQLCKLANMLLINPSKYATLIFLDPFSMEVKWECISSLKDTRTDMWILVPTGTIINRLLKKDGELLAPEKLIDFFGMKEEEIRIQFYEKKRETTFFGNYEIMYKIPNAIEKIASLYINRLHTIWKYVTEEPLILYNSKNVPIFHLIFASNNQTAVKIASQIISIQK